MAADFETILDTDAFTDFARLRPQKTSVGPGHSAFGRVSMQRLQFSSDDSRAGSRTNATPVLLDAMTVELQRAFTITRQAGSGQRRILTAVGRLTFQLLGERASGVSIRAQFGHW